MPGKKRSGLTMVELLIVMIIVSILAGGILLTQRGSEASARAAVIMSDLRLMKAGAYFFITESSDFVYTPGTNYAEELGKYMDNGRIINNPVRYSFYADSNSWWVGVRVDNYETNTVKAVLAAKASGRNSSMPLYGSSDIGTTPADASDANLYRIEHSAIWTKAR